MKIVLKGKVAKLTLDTKHHTNRVVAVVHVEDPFSSTSGRPDTEKKIFIPGEELRIGEMLTITVEDLEEDAS